MPLSASEIASLRQQSNVLNAKISALLKLPNAGGAWTNNTTIKDCVCYVRGMDEAKDVHGKEEVPEYPWCKSETSVAAPPEFVLGLLWDAQARFEWDEYAKKERCLIVQKIDENCDVCCFSTTLPTPMSSDRDFIVFRNATTDQATGVTCITMLDCKHPDAKPADGFERGKFLGGAWIVTPDRTGRKCTLLHVVRLDLIGGWTGYPAVIINTVHTRQAGLVASIKAAGETQYVPSAADLDGPAVLQGLLEETDALIETVFTLATEEASAWSVVKEEGGVIVQKKPLAPNFLLHRATFVLPIAPMALIHDVWSLNEKQEGQCRKALDKRVLSEKSLHVYDDRMDISHIVIDSESIRLSNRDYVLLRRWNNRQSSVVYVEKSCTHPAAPKVTDSPLRIEISLAGVLFAHDPKSSGSTVTIIVQQADPGWGPSDPDYINVEEMSRAILTKHGAAPVAATSMFSGMANLLPDVVANAMPTMSMPDMPSLSTLKDAKQPAATRANIDEGITAAAQSGLYETVSPNTQVAMESLVSRELAVVTRLIARHALPQQPGSSAPPAVSAARFTVLFSELVLVFSKNMSNEEVVDTLDNVVSEIPGNITQPEFLSWWMQNSASDRQSMCDAFRRAWGLADSGNTGLLTSAVFFSLVKQFCSVGVAHPLSLGYETLNQKIAEMNEASQGIISLSDGCQWFLVNMYSLQLVSAENVASLLDRCNPKRSLVINPAPIHSIIDVVVPGGSAGSAMLDCKAAGSSGEVDWLHLVAWLYKGMRARLPRPWGSRDEAFEQECESYVAGLRPTDADFLKSVFDSCDSAKKGEIEFGSVCTVMQRLGVDPRLVPWGAGVRKNANGSVSWQGFVMGLGPWLLEQNELSASQGAASQGANHRALADLEDSRRDVVAVALEAFRTHCDANGGLSSDRFVSCALCAAVALGRPLNVQDIEACAEQLLELNTLLTEEEYEDWWKSAMDSDDADAAYRIKAIFDKVSHKFRRQEQVDSEAFSAGVLELITAFPYADLGEDTIVQYMNYIEQSPGGQVAFDDMLRWWTTAITERQLERSRERLQFVVEANRQHADHIPYVTAERLVSKVLPNADVASLKRLPMFVSQGPRGGNAISWNSLLQWMLANSSI